MKHTKKMKIYNSIVKQLNYKDAEFAMMLTGYNTVKKHPKSKLKNCIMYMENSNCEVAAWYDGKRIHLTKRFGGKREYRR